jgi:hypothetical protein
MSFNYVLVCVHWTIADTSARTTRYCTEYRRRRELSHVCMIHTYEVKILGGVYSVLYTRTHRRLVILTDAAYLYALRASST